MRTNLLITVHDKNVEAALRELKRNMVRHGILGEIKKREGHERPGVRKRRKSLKARKRDLKSQKRIAAAMGERELRQYGSSA